MNESVNGGIKKLENGQCSNYKYHSTECIATTSNDKHDNHKADKVVLVSVNDFIDPTKIKVGTNCLADITTKANNCFSSVDSKLTKTELTQKIQCCPAWDVLDCARSSINVSYNLNNMI